MNRLAASAALLALLGCPSDAPPLGSSHGSSVIVGSTAFTVDTGPTTEPVIPWPFPLPWLEGNEWVPGKDGELTIEAAPPGATVVFSWSEEGMVRGDCPSPGPNGCPVLVAPQPLATLVTDAQGSATWTDSVDTYGAQPRVIYLQAHVTDPASGLSTLSNAIQRHVHVPASTSRVRLYDGTAEAGLADLFLTGNSHTGGLAWPDVNGDHWPDLFVANGGGTAHRLFRNNGDGTFTDWSTRIRKPSNDLETAATHFADVDLDGDLDLLAVVDSAVQMNSEAVQPLEGGPNLLYINQGDGTFTEEAAQRGLVDPRGWRNITGAFGDFDGDGDVDVYLATWAMNQQGVARDGHLLLNDGTGHFVDSGQQLGQGRDVLTSIAADLNQDGLSDLYLGHVNKIEGFHGVNPQADDALLLNQGGQLTDVTADSWGLGDDAWAAMGLDVADIDNDGDFDLYETDRWEVDDTLPRGNSLYVQQADGTFADNSCDVADVCTSYAGWPTFFADFDRDGWVDLYVGTGKEWYPDLIYVNDGDGTFTSHWVPTMQDSPVRGGAQADVDGDGDVDFAVWQYNADLRLFRNEPRDTGHWLELELVDSTGADPFAIGAVVQVTRSDGLSQLRRVSGGDSAHSQSSHILHWGLGADAGPVDVEVLWPGGARSTYSDVPIDAFLLLDRSSGVLEQALEEGTATYDPISQQLHVEVALRYGGRRVLQTPYGTLTWDPDALRFVGTFSPGEVPTTVLLTNDRFGESFELAVE